MGQPRTEPRHNHDPRTKRAAAAAAQWSPHAVRGLVNVLGRKWALEAIDELSDGPLRRHLLRERLHPISDKVFTSVLRRLESAGFITHAFVSDVPPRTDYTLTALGKSLTELLDSVATWCLSQASDDSVAPGAR